MTTDPTKQPEPQAGPGQVAQPAEVARQLSEMVDLIEYQDVIGRKTHYGKKPGPEPWYHTRALLRTYTDPPDAEDLIRLFESVGCKDEVAAAKWIVINDELIP